MWRLVLAALAVLSIANAAAMWFVPEYWFNTLPGVSMTGPFNIHFVRDIALIFLFSGGALAWGAWRNARVIALAGAAWPVLHALFHVSIWFARGMPFDEVGLVNLVGVQVPAWLALFAAWQLGRISKDVRQ